MVGYFKTAIDFQSACKDIGKDENEIKENLKELREWFKGQKHLPHNAIDEVMMCKFLFGSKGDMEKVKFKLDAYLSVRNLVPAIYSDRDPETEIFRSANDFMYLGILPDLTPDGSRVVVFTLREEDPSGFNFTAVLRRTYALYDVWLKSDPNVSKIYIFVDMKPTRVGHIRKISLPRLREAAFCFQNVLPFRIQGLIFINVGSVTVSMIETLLKPLFKKKIAERFSVYSEDISGLNDKIPISMLPSEYGGAGPSLEALNDSWIEEVNKNREWLMTSGSLASDESLREGKNPVTMSTCTVM